MKMPHISMTSTKALTMQITSHVMIFYAATIVAYIMLPSTIPQPWVAFLYMGIFLLTVISFTKNIHYTTHSIVKHRLSKTVGDYSFDPVNHMYPYTEIRSITSHYRPLQVSKYNFSNIDTYIKHDHGGGMLRNLFIVFSLVVLCIVNILLGQDVGLLEWTPFIAILIATTIWIMLECNIGNVPAYDGPVFKSTLSRVVHLSNEIPVLPTIQSQK